MSSNIRLAFDGCGELVSIQSDFFVYISIWRRLKAADTKGVLERSVDTQQKYYYLCSIGFFGKGSKMLGQIKGSFV